MGLRMSPAVDPAWDTDGETAGSDRTRAGGAGPHLRVAWRAERQRAHTRGSGRRRPFEVSRTHKSQEVRAFGLTRKRWWGRKVVPCFLASASSVLWETPCSRTRPSRFAFSRLKSTGRLQDGGPSHGVYGRRCQGNLREGQGRLDKLDQDLQAVEGVHRSFLLLEGEFLRSSASRQDSPAEPRAQLASPLSLSLFARSVQPIY
mmetsp:Transcript_13844/g.34814  ORF Transcript_13844/g.34814 Transcript_13844/m.34814 type:complete len:203 (-) Transcript_13844:811-1419(-)